MKSLAGCGFAGLAGLALLGACGTPPAHVDPRVELPESFSASGEKPLQERWWLSLEDAALDGLIEEALRQNLDLRTTWDRLAQAEAIARREGAALLPDLEASAGASTSRSKQIANGTTMRESSNSFSLGLAASYEVDLWERIRSGRDAAALDVEAGQQELLAAAITLSARVASTWYQLVEQRGQLELLAQQIDSNERVLAAIQQRFSQGLAGAADVLRQRRLVESTRAERILAQESLELLEHELAILLGKAPGMIPIPQRSEPLPLPQLPATGLPAELVGRRPDVRQAYLEVLAADRRLAEAIAERYPRITLSAQASTAAEKLHDLFDNWAWSLAGGLLQPLFDNDLRAAEIDRNEALRSQRLHAYAQSILLALGEVEDALVQERQQRALLANIEARRELSRQVLESLRARYLKGQAAFIDVLEAQTSWQALQRSELTARRQLVEFRINLCRALGGGWELERPALAAFEPERRES